MEVVVARIASIYGPRANNWVTLCRSIQSGRFRMIDKGLIRTAPAAREESNLPIGQMRWSPVPIPTEPLTFVTGLRTVTTAGDASDRIIYNTTNGNLYYDADGTGGGSTATLFATLAGAPVITASDIFIIP